MVKVRYIIESIEEAGCILARPATIVSINETVSCALLLWLVSRATICWRARSTLFVGKRASVKMI